MKTNKKIIFISFIIILIFLFINVLSFITIKLVTKKNIYTNEYVEFKKRFRKSEFKTLYPHPFFGFGTRQDYNSNNFINSEPLFINEINNFEKNNNKIKILILGGSVATHLSFNNANDEVEFMDKKISNINIFQDTLNNFYSTEKFEVYNAAIGGGKQPQQLFKLYYLDFADYKFDIIINLDGFNELALPLSENYLINDHLIYPRNFSRLISTFNTNFDCVKDLNKKIKKESLLPIIEFYNLYFIRKCHFKLEGQNKNSGTRFSEITNYIKDDYDVAFEKAKYIWKISSQKIENFSDTKGILYFHIIQPNLYLKKSKILTKKEKQLLTYPKYGDVISKFYDTFNTDDLTVKNTLDLKYLFKENKSELYRDYCCHLNNLGMHLISLEIIKKFNQEFRSFL